jgi:hypothetical protein
VKISLVEVFIANAEEPSALIGTDDDGCAFGQVALTWRNSTLSGFLCEEIE